MSERASWTQPLVAAIVTTLMVLGCDAGVGSRLVAHAGAGVQGRDVLWAVAGLTPNFVALGLWLAVPFWRRQARDPRGGARIRRRGTTTEARPPAFGPLANAAGMMALVALPLAILVAVVTDSRPSLGVAWGALALVAATGLVEVVRAGTFARSGAAELVIDPVARELTLPRRRIDEAPRRIPWSEVQAIVVDDPQPVSSTRRGRRRALARGYAVAVLLPGDPGPRLPIGSWPERAAAERFRGWLAGEIAPAPAGVSRSA
jgi:hypothetical protein